MVSRWDLTPYWVIAAPGDVYIVQLADGSGPTGNILDTGEIVLSGNDSDSTFSDTDSFGRP